MATAAELPLSDATDIVAVVERDRSVVLFDQEKFDAWFERLKDEAPKNVDITSKKGRDTLRSYAADIRSKKAEINRDRLKLTKEWRDLTSKVNEAGKAIDEQLETLADEVRKPLTDWEEAEKARVAHCRAVIDGLKAMARVDIDDTAAVVRERGSVAWNTELAADEFGDMLAEAEAAKAQTVDILKTALTRLTKEEADRAELERLRAEAAEREAREQAERDRREAEERAAAEAAAAEARRVAAEQAEAERVERLRKDAAEQAQRAAEAAARAEQDRRDREHAEALAAERRRAEQAERDAQAERDRIAAEEAARAAEARRLAAEQAAREANKAHRARIKTAAKQAIMTCGASEDTAQKIVLAIIAGEIPAVSLRF